VKRLNQVHCLVDCYASIVKESCQLDYRPLYIGIWNAHFDVSEKGISYFHDSMDPYDWPGRFQLLYGKSMENWFVLTASKRHNFSTLVKLMNDREPHKVIVILIDLYYLSYSNQYGLKHSPHYVIVEHRSEHNWYIIDPYVNWQGYVSHIDMWNAFGFENYGAGIIVDTSLIHAPDYRVVSRCFEQEMALTSSRLLVEVDKFVHTSIINNGGYAPDKLFDAVQAAGVLSKRFGGYIYVFQYFAESCDVDTGAFHSSVEQLVKAWEKLMLAIARFQILKKEVDLQVFAAKMNHLFQLEMNVKKLLNDVFIRWRAAQLGTVYKEKVE
jgi:hypothetical protein